MSGFSIRRCVNKRVRIFDEQLYDDVFFFFFFFYSFPLFSTRKSVCLVSRKFSLLFIASSLSFSRTDYETSRIKSVRKVAEAIKKAGWEIHSCRIM